MGAQHLHTSGNTVRERAHPRNSRNPRLIFVSLCLIPTHGPVKKLINPRDSDERNARRLDTWEVLPVLRQIGSLRSLLRRNALLLEAADLAPHIAKVRLKVIDLGSVRESVAVTGKNGYEIELLQLLQGFAPLIHKCIAHVRKRRRQHVSRTNNLLFWKVHNDIAGSMGTTEKTNLDFAIAPVQRHLGLESHVWRCGFQFRL